MKKQPIIQVINDLITKTENNLGKIKMLLAKIENGESDIDDSDLDLITNTAHKLNKPSSNETEIVVEGIFDGNNMIGSDNKKYVVPQNYSSKSKIIQGDHLKLKIQQDGSMIYKIILQIDRKSIKGLITKNDEAKFVALGDDERIYNLNQAAVSFFHGKPGDEAVLIINADKKCDYAALEAIINVEL